MRRLLPTILLVATACLPRLDITVPGNGPDPGDGGSTEDGGAPDDTGLPSAPSVSTIDPTDGPTNGGMVVAILGGPFDDSVQVTFDQRGATLATMAEDRLTVVAPPAADGAGSVDITVRTDAGSVTVSDAYTYWDNANGKTVLIGIWTQLIAAGSASTVVQHDTWVRFVDPVDAVPRDRYGLELGECGMPSNGLTSRQGPATVQLGHPDALLDLPWNGERLEYTWSGDTLPALVTEDQLTFVTPLSSLSPALTLDEVAEVGTPSGPTSPNLTLDAPQLISEAAQVTWTAGDADYVMLAGANEGGTMFVCLAPDSGSFTIPSDLFEDLAFEPRDASSEQAAMWLGFGRATSVETELEYDAGLAIFDTILGVAGEVTVTRDRSAGVAP